MVNKTQNQIPPTPFTEGGASSAPFSVHIHSKKNMPVKTRKAILTMYRFALKQLEKEELHRG